MYNKFFGRRGFTLSEVIIALAIFAVSSAMLAFMLNGAIRINRDNVILDRNIRDSVAIIQTGQYKTSTPDADGNPILSGANGYEMRNATADMNYSYGPGSGENGAITLTGFSYFVNDTSDLRGVSVPMISGKVESTMESGDKVVDMKEEEGGGDIGDPDPTAPPGDEASFKNESLGFGTPGLNISSYKLVKQSDGVYAIDITISQDRQLSAVRMHDASFQLQLPAGFKAGNIDSVTYSGGTYQNQWQVSAIRPFRGSSAGKISGVHFLNHGSVEKSWGNSKFNNFKARVVLSGCTYSYTVFNDAVDESGNKVYRGTLMYNESTEISSPSSYYLYYDEDNSRFVKKTFSGGTAAVEGKISLIYVKQNGDILKDAGKYVGDGTKNNTAYSSKVVTLTPRSYSGGGGERYYVNDANGKPVKEEEYNIMRDHYKASGVDAAISAAEASVYYNSAAGKKVAIVEDEIVSTEHDVRTYVSADLADAVEVGEGNLNRSGDPPTFAYTGGAFSGPSFATPGIFYRSGATQEKERDPAVYGDTGAYEDPVGSGSYWIDRAVYVYPPKFYFKSDKPFITALRRKQGFVYDYPGVYVAAGRYDVYVNAS